MDEVQKLEDRERAIEMAQRMHLDSLPPKPAAQGGALTEHFSRQAWAKTFGARLKLLPKVVGSILTFFSNGDDKAPR